MRLAPAKRFWLIKNKFNVFLTQKNYSQKSRLVFGQQSPLVFFGQQVRLLQGKMRVLAKR